jgi:hypothetical protein
MPGILRPGRAERSPQGGKSPHDGLFERLISVNDGFRQRDGLESRLHLEIKLKVSVSRGMRSRSELLGDALPGRYLATNALQDSPGLVQGSGYSNRVLDLTSAGKRAAVKKDDPGPIPLQKVARGLQHQFEAEIILPRRVLNLPGQENRVADFIFAHDTAGTSGGQCLRKCGLASAGEAGHQDDHFNVERSRLWSSREF